MSIPARVGERYEIVRQLGGGSQGDTFLARDDEAREVVLKRFSIREMRGWKSLELFQREVATLALLDHPAIPDFVDDIEFEGCHYLVQEFVDGEVLSEIAARGPMPEPELRAVARDVLGVLAYLHELNPPVVHRDVKPSNIIRRPDGSHALVDFGGVQMIVAQDTGGSTVVGTTGYMPSEQLVGRAVPQSDLYALGATLAHLATGIHPSELPTTRLRLDWRGAAEVSQPLAELLDQMLNPAPEDRPATARAALAALQDATAIERVGALSPVVASMEKHIKRTPQRLELHTGTKRGDGFLVVIVVGILGAVGILTFNALAAEVVIGLCLFTLIVHGLRSPSRGTLSATGSRRTSEEWTQQLFVQSDGAAWTRIDTESGKQIIRGPLLLEDDKLFVVDPDHGPVRVAETLTAEQARWFADEARAFVDSADRLVRSLPDARPEAKREPEPEVEIEPPPSSEPVVEESPQLPVPVVEPQVELYRVPKPEHPCPPKTVARFERDELGWSIDLGPKLDRSDAVITAGLVLASLLIAVILWNPVPVAAGLILSVFALLTTVSQGSHEVLSVDADGAFYYRSQANSGEVFDKAGRLSPSVDTSASSIRLTNADGEDGVERFDIGLWLSEKERVWVAWRLQQILLDNEPD